MSGTSLPLAKPPLPTERPRFSAGTTVGGRKVGGQYMPDSVISVARAGMVSQEQLDQAQKTIQQQQEQINNAQKELNDQQQQIDQVQRTVQEQQPSRMQRLAGAVSRTIAPVRALGTMGVIRSINRAANTNSSLINYDLMDARRVAEAGAYGGARMGPGGSLGGAERVLFNISRDMSAVRGSLSRIEANVNKIVGDNQPGGGVAPRAAGQEEGRGGIAGIIGSLLGGLGNMFGGGGGGGLGGAIRRLISTVARAIFTKIPIIGPLILVALNIEGAMEEYERNGLGAAITDLLSGIGSDLTFGIVSKDSIKEFINNGIARVTEWWNTAKDTLQGVVDSVIENVGNFYTNVRERFAETRDAIASRVNAARETIATRLGELGSSLSNVVSSIGDFFSSLIDRFRRVRDRITQAAQNPDPGTDPFDTTNMGLGEEQTQTQPAARQILGVGSEEYSRIRNMLEQAPAGETADQRQERERLRDINRRNERYARRIGGDQANVSIEPEVSAFISNRETAQARESEAGAIFGSNSNQERQGSWRQTIEGNFSLMRFGENDPEGAREYQDRLRQRTQEIIEQEQARRPLDPNMSNARLSEELRAQRRRAENTAMSEILPDFAERINNAGAGNLTVRTTATGSMVPTPQDVRAQAMARGADQPVNVTVNNVAGGGQGAPAATPAAPSSGTRAAGRAPRQPTHSPRPADIGSAASAGYASVNF